jgi:hypothetical protein
VETSEGATHTETAQRVAFKIINTRSHEIALVLEPWGDVLPLLPGDSYDVVLRGPSGESPIIQLDDTYITVFGWSGCIIKLFKDGAIVPGYEREGPPVPGTPQGMGMNEFVDLMFGKGVRANNEDSQ